MRRARDHGTPGDIALMAVITKAMGAFLILMIMLIPYYSSDPGKAPGVDEMRQRLDKVAQEMKSLMERAGAISVEDLTHRLKEALEELERARQLIADLKAHLDQAAAVVRRLETQLEAANQNLAAARSRIAELEQTIAQQEAKIERQAAEIAALARENEQLRREIERLKAADPEPLLARIRQLEQQLAAANAQVQELNRQIADLQAKYALLEQENAQLRRRRPSFVHVEATLTGTCPKDAIEVVLVRPQADGTPSDGTQLAPWMGDRARVQIEQVRSNVVAFPEGAPLRERILLFLPREQPVSLDVYLRYKDAERHKKELQTIADRLAALSAQTPPDDSRRADRISEVIRRFSQQCVPIVTVVAETGIEWRGVALSLFEPVAFAGQVAFEADGRVRFPSNPGESAKLRAALPASLCDAVPEHCELARRAGSRGR